MEDTKGAKKNDKAYVGDWSETSDGAQAYARVTQPVKASTGAFLHFFAAAFHSSGPSPMDRKGNQRTRGQCLDIGCGPGGFTLNYLLPCLPSWCEKLVAVDNSEAMQQLAREKQSHAKVEHKYLDIALDDDVAQFCEREGCFEMVFSFGALHWIADQHQAIRNIEKLMAPGGECFVSFAGTMILFDLFASLMESPRWTMYSQHLRKVVPATHGMDKLALRSYTASLLDGLDLTPLACEVFSEKRVLDVTPDELADFYTTSNPIYHLLSDMEQEELAKFTQEFIQERVKKNSGKLTNESAHIIIHACKAPRKNDM
ncbi:uncharacterized protein LOC144141966 [Haemaphysalis longicornis]